MSPILLARLFLPFAAGYALSELTRGVNTIIFPHLVADIQISVTELGFLTSTYFLTFAAFQLPLGVCLDRFGPQKTNAVLLTIAGAGCLLFATGSDVHSLMVARGLIGLGVSGCLMAAFKAFALWFEDKDRALINGCQLCAGGLGAIFGSRPTYLLVEAVGWRHSFMLFALLMFVVAAALWWLVPRRQPPPAPSMRQQWDEVLAIGRSPPFLIIVPHFVVVQGTFLAMWGLWVSPWLRDIAGYDRDTIANTLLWMAIAMTAGSLFWGLIADRCRDLGFNPWRVATLGSGGFVVINTLIPIIPTPWLLWPLFTLMGAGTMPIYVTLANLYPPAMNGRVITGLNFLVFAYAFLLQWLAGVIIDLWPLESEAHGALQSYPWQGYLSVQILNISLMLITAWWMIRNLRRGRVSTTSSFWP